MPLGGSLQNVHLPGRNNETKVHTCLLQRKIMCVWTINTLGLQWSLLLCTTIKTGLEFILPSLHMTFIQDLEIKLMQG